MPSLRRSASYGKSFPQDQGQGIGALLLAPMSVSDRLASYTEKGPDCWLWVGKINSAGYGQIFVSRRWTLAHRTAWSLANARPIPARAVVMHTCDNRRCVRPDHLQLGTQADNVHDAIAKGRHYFNYRPRALVCKKCGDHLPADPARRGAICRPCDLQRLRQRGRTV